MIAGRSTDSYPHQDVAEKNIRPFAAFKQKPRTVVIDDDFEEEDDSFGYEDDFSIGIDLPVGAEATSGIKKILRFSPFLVPNFFLPSYISDFFIRDCSVQQFHPYTPKFCFTKFFLLQLESSFCFSPIRRHICS